MLSKPVVKPTGLANVVLIGVKIGAWLVTLACQFRISGELNVTLDCNDSRLRTRLRSKVWSLLEHFIHLAAIDIENCARYP
jgi:hypothetical protein